MFKRILLTVTTLTFAATSLHAQDGANHPLFKDDWLIRIGGQQSDADARIGLANPDLGDIPILDLGAGDADTSIQSIGAGIVWQAPDRWSFGVTYYRAEVDGEKISREDFSFGDVFIPAGTGISADFDTDFYVINGYYDFYQAPGSSAGIGFGIYVLDLSVSAELVVDGVPSGTRDGADTLAPLPTVSAYYRHAFNDQWALSTGLSYFSAEIDQYDGDIFSADVSVEYWPSHSWGLGAGYSFVDLDLTVDKNIFDQKYKVKYDSFFLYATFGF